jgi:hypothetical protein
VRAIQLDCCGHLLLHVAIKLHHCIRRCLQHLLALFVLDLLHALKVVVTPSIRMLMLLLSAHAVGLGLDHVGAQTTLLDHVGLFTENWSAKSRENVSGFSCLQFYSVAKLTVCGCICVIILLISNTQLGEEAKGSVIN